MLKKLISLMAVLLLALSLNQFSAYAEDKATQVTIDKDISNCVFQISWENSDKNASVVLKSPDGREYGKKATPNVYNETKGSVVIFVGSAKAGVWSVNISGESLGKVTVSGGELPKYIQITKFNAVKTADDKITITWAAKNSSGSISYSVFADTSDKGRSGVQVANFGDAAQGSREIQIENLSTGDYYFYLRAEDGNVLPDYLYCSTKIHIVNKSIPETVQGVTASMVNGDIFVKWQPPEGASAYRVMFFETGSGKLLFSSDTDKNWYSYPAPADSDKLDVGVAVVKGELSGSFSKISVPLKVDFNAKVGLPESKNINSKKIIVPVKFPEGYKLDIFNNGKYLIQDQIKAGDYSVALEDGENHLGFVITDSKGNKKSYEGIYYVDTYPPQLQMTADLNGKHFTSPNIYIPGKTEPSAKVKINGRNVSVGKSGSFSFKLRMMPGKNKITIISSDLAGNQSKIVFTATFDVLGSWLFYAGIILAIFLALSIYYAIVFFRAGKKRTAKTKDTQGLSDESGKEGEQNDEEGN